MGLDIYVGTLTRYYSGQWETIVQQSAHGSDGVEVLVVRPSSPDAENDPSQILPAVLDWRQEISDGLGQHLQTPLDWDESADAPYFTDKPGRRCFNALVSWADRHDDESTPRFLQLRKPIDMWLPCDFSFVFQAGTPAGNTMKIGSSWALREVLDRLNSETWKADENTTLSWRKEVPSHEDSAEREAAFGWSIVRHLASLSVEHRLPMLMDE